MLVPTRARYPEASRRRPTPTWVTSRGAVLLRQMDEAETGLGGLELDCTPLVQRGHSEAGGSDAAPCGSGAKTKSVRAGKAEAREWKKKRDDERRRREDERAAAAAEAGPPDTPFPCKICGQGFASKNKLFAHLRSGGECSRLTADGGQPAVAKKERIVLLVGYIADRFRTTQGTEYIAQHGCIGEVSQRGPPTDVNAAPRATPAFACSH